MTIIYGRWDVISFHKNLAKPWAWLIWRRNAKSDHFLDKVYRSHLRPSSFFVRNAKDDHKVQLGIATKVVFVVLRNAKTTFVLNCTRSNGISFKPHENLAKYTKIKKLGPLRPKCHEFDSRAWQCWVDNLVTKLRCRKWELNLRPQSGMSSIPGHATWVGDKKQDFDYFQP